MSSVFLEDLDAETYAAYVRQSTSTVIIPTGATEQHGPHMPPAVDALLSTSTAGCVAEQVDAEVAPVYADGYKSQPRAGGRNHRIRTTSLSASTMIDLVEDVASSFQEQGFSNVVVLNGH